MIFKSIQIKNFRNFKDISIDLSNKNVFFGLNDVGKTNFLYAVRFLFDKEVRKQNFTDSDYHSKNINEDIELIVTIDISDSTCADNQKLRAQLKGSLLSSHNQVFIKLIAKYDSNELLGIPELFWGGDPKKLYEMKQRGFMYEIDYVVNLVYIDSYVDLYKLFKKNINRLVKNDDPSDNNIIDKITTTVGSLNKQIASLSGVKKFETKITPEYKKFRNDKVSVSVKSEIAIKGLYSNIIPYIKQDNDANLYPTSGEGRKKLLSYALFDLISEETSEKKINIFLIEEPENHLHKSMQMALSKFLFNDSKYKYLFVSTHSPYILYEMDSVNLVRVYNESKVNSASIFYQVPNEFSKNKKILNKNLSEAIFADKVLLVEGASEVMLFEKVLSVINPFFEADGAYILMVNGIGFDKYFTILDKLNIKCILRTDNDLRSTKSGTFSVLGFSRCNKYIKDGFLPTKQINSNTVADKRSLYNSNKSKIDYIRKEYLIYLSKCDLENDLDEIMHSRLKKLLGTEDVVDYLQKAKHYNMVELTEKLSDRDCKKIYNHYNFACLKEVLE